MSFELLKILTTLLAMIKLSGSTRTRTEIALKSRAYTDYKSVMLPLHHGTDIISPASNTYW